MASRVDKIYGDAYISVKTDEDDLLEALEEAKAVKEIFGIAYGPPPMSTRDNIFPAETASMP